MFRIWQGDYQPYVRGMKISVLILIVHAICALGMLGLCFFQYKWKKRGKVLTGDERKYYLEQHEKVGQKTIYALVVVVLLAIIGNATMGLSAGYSFFTSILPRSPHGVFGFIGAGLFYYAWKLGIKIQKQREGNEKWATTKIKHGRAADLIIIIGCIHAFLGFLQLLKII